MEHFVGAAGPRRLLFTIGVDGLAFKHAEVIGCAGLAVRIGLDASIGIAEEVIGAAEQRHIADLLVAARAVRVRGSTAEDAEVVGPTSAAVRIRLDTLVDIADRVVRAAELAGRADSSLLSPRQSGSGAGQSDSQIPSAEQGSSATSL